MTLDVIQNLLMCQEAMSFSPSKQIMIIQNFPAKVSFSVGVLLRDGIYYDECVCLLLIYLLYIGGMI